MTKEHQSSSRSEGFVRSDLENELKAVFERLPHPVSVYLVAGRAGEDVLSRAARELIRGFQGLSDRIRVTEVEPRDDLARKWKVNSIPTFLFDPEHYSIRYLGVPFGEEARTLLGILILLGYRSGNLTEQSARVLQRIDTPRRIKVFVSATCPYCPEQAMNAARAAMEKPDLISVEIIDIQSNQEMANRYSAFSVPQVFANEVLIAQGAQSEELFMLSLEKMEQQTLFIPESDSEEVETDLLIVGGGPAGLTAGIYAVRSGLKTAIVEKGPLGGQIATTPVVENYPGFTRVPGKALVDILASHALEYVQIFPGEEVVEVRPGNPIRIRTTRRRFKAGAVILATGATYRRLGVPGEMELAGRGVSYCATCDGTLFKGKKVLVVGGGNSALTEALYLSNIGVSVTLVHRRDAFRAQEHLVKNVAANRIPVLWDTEVKEIRGREQVTQAKLVNRKTGETTWTDTDGVFVAIGYVPTVDLARKLGVEVTPDGFIRHDAHHRTNIPGIYSAGDVEGGYKQIVTAMAQGTEAALSVYEDLTHPYWKQEGAPPG